MTIDERLAQLVARHEALTQSVELLTHDIQEMNARMERADARERTGRAAILQAIAAYLNALNGQDEPH